MRYRRNLWIAAWACLLASCDKPTPVSGMGPAATGPEGALWESLAWIPQVDRAQVAVYDYPTLQKVRHLWWGSPTWKSRNVIWHDLQRGLGLPESSIQRCIYLLDEAPESGWMEAYLIQTTHSADEVAKKSGDGAEEVTLGTVRGWKKRGGIILAYVDGWILRAGSSAPDSDKPARLLGRILAVHAGKEPSLRSMPGIKELVAKISKTLPVELMVGQKVGDVAVPVIPRATAVHGDLESARTGMVSVFATEKDAAAYGAMFAKDAGHLVSAPEVETRGTFVSVRIQDRRIAGLARQQVQSDLAALQAALAECKKSGAGLRWASPNVPEQRYPKTEEGVPLAVEDWDLCGAPLLDPWGSPYHYRFPHPAKPDAYDLRSAGPDGKINTIDDILPDSAVAGATTAKPSDGEREARKTLRALYAAEMVLQVNDRDSNAKDDFWVGDVSGLYRLLDTSKAPIKILEARFAEADSAPLSSELLAPHTTDQPKPVTGYLLCVIRKDAQGNNYGDSAHRSSQKFAFCAYPAAYGKTGINTFIMSNEVEIYAKDTGGRPVTQWPDMGASDKTWRRSD